jgi:acyl dehydratase
MSKFEAIQVGDRAHLNRLITSEDIEIFAKLTGDKNPLHFDKEFAKQRNFEAPIAHGMLTASFLSTLTGMMIPGKGAILTNVKINFRKPVFVDDVLSIVVEVTKKISLSKNIFLSAKITNQHGQVVATGDIKSIYPE